MTYHLSLVVIEEVGRFFKILFPIFFSYGNLIGPLLFRGRDVVLIINQGEKLQDNLILGNPSSGNSLCIVTIHSCSEETVWSGFE